MTIGLSLLCEKHEKAGTLFDVSGDCLWASTLHRLKAECIWRDENLVLHLP